MCHTHLRSRLREVADLPKLEVNVTSDQKRTAAPAGSELPSVIGLLANVRSLRQAAGDVRKLVSGLDPDVFFLTETHLRDDPINSMLPPDYKVVSRYDRTLRGGGVIAGCKSHLLATPLNLSKYTVPKKAEMVGFELDGIDFITCYTSNSTTACVLIARCVQYLLDHPLHQVVLLGDFNAHNADWLSFSSSTDRAGTDVQEMCETYGFNQLVDFPTRGVNTLDLVITPFEGTAVPMANAGTSDHRVVAFEMQVLKPPEPPPIRQSVRDWDHAPWHHIKGAIRRYLKHWDPCAFASPSLAQSNLSEWMDAIIDRYVPLTSPVSNPNAPWWNFHCEKAYKWKQRAFVDAGPDSEEYARAVSWNRTVQKKAFKSYNIKLRARLQKIGTSDRVFWDTVKEIGGLSSARSSAAPSAEALAEHFATKMMTSGKDRSDDDFTPITAAYYPLSGFKIRFKNVVKALRRLNPSKSANGAGPRFLRECADVLAPVVNRLFKFIVRAAQFPMDWKIGRVTPVHKRAKVSVEANYRPVTVLDNLESVFEECTKQQFEKWITSFIPEWQYGFVSQHGTADYGAALAFTLQDCLERRQEGLLIATDIAGAFDRCWWKRLLNRLRAAGLRGKALQLMRSYLRNRFIQVVVSGCSSSLKQIYSGVPQGAKWSSLLWDFDISEMCEGLESNASSFGYADDVSLWYEIDPDRSPDEVVSEINSDMVRLHAWGVDNNTTFEKSKMEMVLISQRHHRFDPTGICFDGFNIPLLPHIKLVGFTVDSRLRWGPMIDGSPEKRDHALEPSDGLDTTLTAETWS